MAQLLEPPPYVAAMPADARRRLAEVLRGIVAERQEPAEAAATAK